MTAHLHSTFVDGCYRCEIGRDEVEQGYCDTHQDSTRQVCPCVGFDGRCHECPDPSALPPCMVPIGSPVHPHPEEQQ